jgi:hypothetical protein
MNELSFRSLIKNYKFGSAFVKYFLAAASIALAALAVYGTFAYNLHLSYLKSALSKF